MRRLPPRRGRSAVGAFRLYASPVHRASAAQHGRTGPEVLGLGHRPTDEQFPQAYVHYRILLSSEKSARLSLDSNQTLHHLLSSQCNLTIVRLSHWHAGAIRSVAQNIDCITFAMWLFALFWICSGSAVDVECR
jgi:hypothetical protein